MGKQRADLGKRPANGAGVGIVEHDARALARAGVEVPNRIREPPGAPHDGHRSVTQAVHLVEAAGLVSRGHQEGVAAGLDPVGEFLVLALAKRDAARMGRSQSRKELLALAVAAAQHREGEVSPRYRFRQCLEQQVDPLLPGQAGDDADQRPAGTRVEAEALAQRLAHLRLARQVARRVMPGQVAVGRRIPLPRVDAVEDADDGVPARAQHPVETHALLGRADFPGVGRAHGADDVGIPQALPEKIDPARGELVGIEVAGGVPEPELAGRGRGQHPLVAQIVDGQHRTGPRKQRLGRACRLQVQGQQRRVPVVAMDDVRGQPQAAAGLQRGPAEQQETQVLVGTVAVEAAPRVQRRTVDEQQVRQSCAAPAAQDRVAVALRAECEFEAFEAGDRLDRHAVATELRVERQERKHRVAAIVQQARQRRGDVGEAADLRVRRQLRGDETDREFHPASL